MRALPGALAALLLSLAMGCRSVALPAAGPDKPHAVVPVVVQRAPPETRTPPLASIAPAAAHVEPPKLPRRVAYGEWRALRFGSYLMPREDFVDEDGAVDLVVHLRWGRLADDSYRAAGLPAVIVAAELGGSAAGYADAMRKPESFAAMLSEVLGAVGARLHRSDLHVGRLGLVAWSAGWAAVDRILSFPKYYDAVDAVFLLDALHAPYVDPVPPGAGEHGIPFRHLVDEGALAPFVRFAHDAVRGDKIMVLTHSSVVPPDYASTTETAFTLVHAVDARVEEASGKNARGMKRSDTADLGDFHVRGYWGATPEEHVAHLQLAGDLVTELLEPRWEEPGG